VHNQHGQVGDKVDEYLRIIQERILAPIKRTEIQSSCTATLLLLFAAIDGLGKLLHPKDTAGVTFRINKFLDYMGGEYAVHKQELSKLRNSLVHNAINVESYMSNLSEFEINSDLHLKKIGDADFIYVNTVIMANDFEKAFTRFKLNIQNDPVLKERADNRLKWAEVDPDDIPENSNAARPSPAPPVEFLRTKR